jgi:phosphoglycolate phosphatase|tara:strand:- start:2014 stop:2712 length:699 start_codon:yes stop_codon:yes gene_type:complete
MLPDFSKMQNFSLIFDLDGTLVDSAPDLFAALNFCLSHAGRETIDLDHVRHMVGQGARALLEKGLIRTGGMLERDEFEALAQEFFLFYEDHLSDATLPYPGVVNALETFRAENVPLAVCTNKPVGFARKLLDELEMSRYFRAVTGGDSFKMRKPAAGHITGTLAEMAHRGDAAFMIGDSATDINAAHNASIPCIAVSYGYTETPVHDLGPDHIIDHFDELVPLIRRLTETPA